MNAGAFNQIETFNLGGKFQVIPSTILRGSGPPLEPAAGYTETTNPE